MRIQPSFLDNGPITNHILTFGLTYKFGAYGKGVPVVTK
jgi:hypothetical protein